MLVTRQVEDWSNMESRMRERARDHRWPRAAEEVREQIRCGGSGARWIYHIYYPPERMEKPGTWMEVEQQPESNWHLAVSEIRRLFPPSPPPCVLTLTGLLCIA